MKRASTSRARAAATAQRALRAAQRPQHGERRARARRARGRAASQSRPDARRLPAAACGARLDRAPGVVHRLLRRLVPGHRGADRDLELLARSPGRRQRRGGPCRARPSPRTCGATGSSRKKGTSRKTLRRTGRWPVAWVMRPDVRGRLDELQELRRRPLPHGIPREHHPHPAAGPRRPRAGVFLRNRRHVPLRELRRRQPGLEVAELPVAAQEHGGVAGDGRRGQLLVVVVAQHGARRRAARDGLAQERQHVDHVLAVRRLAEDRPTRGIHQLPALRPEHREVVEDRPFPAARVVEVARRSSSRGDAARHVEQLVPGRGRRGHQVLAVIEQPAVGAVPHPVDVPLRVGEGIDRERQVVRAVLRRPVRLERLDVPAVEEQRHPEAVHRRDVGQASRRRGQQQLRLVHLEGGHRRDLELHVGMGAGVVLHDVAEDAPRWRAGTRGASSPAAPRP